MAIATGTALALASLAAAGVSAYNTQQTAKKADRTAAAGIEAQNKNRRAAQQKIDQTVDKIGAGDAGDARATAGKQYLDQVRASLGQANAAQARKGLNADFDARAGGATAANETYGARTADLLARMDAPVLQRQAESNTVGDAGMDLAVLDSKAQGDAFLNDIAMRGVRRNPYMDFASAALQGYASSARPTGGGGGAGGAVSAGTGTGRGIYGAASRGLG